MSARGSGARWVALGILVSRLVGFVRERAFAHFFGVGPHTDVLKAAFRAPNLLQNLLGEGSLSAAFIPIYSRLLEQGRERDAGRFAGAVFSLLVAVAAVLALLGIVFARPLVALFSPGYLGDAAVVAAGEQTLDRYELAVVAVRILFPMTGLLVLAAWALGVLNSHRRFLLPYLAPVVWNLAILAALIGGAVFLTGHPLGREATAAVAVGEDALRSRLVIAACLGALAGGLLQFLVQLPLVIRVLSGFELSLSTRVAGVRESLRAFGPVVAGRGVTQLSAYLDIVLASLLAVGAQAALGFAAQLYVLPVSLFGLSVAAAELPELSRLGGGARRGLRERGGRERDLDRFLTRMGRSLTQMTFFVVPTCVGYLAFGSLLVGTLYRTGEFGPRDTALVATVLAAYALGLPATTPSRLLQNAFFALSDTRTPAKVAVLRVAVSVTVALPAMFLLDRLPVTALGGMVPGLSPDSLAGGAEEVGGRTLYLGATGLALGSAVGAWVELAVLLRALRRPLPELSLPWRGVLRQTALALAALAPAAALWLVLPRFHPALTTLLVVGLYAGVYLAAAQLLGVSELRAWLGRRGP